MEEVKVMTAHQALLLEMLKDFDAVCRRHHISYQLFAGTALGAVRHHGFIPWDDDVDVILVRSEYDRLLTEAAGDFDPERYYVQRKQRALAHAVFQAAQKPHGLHRKISSERPACPSGCLHRHFSVRQSFGSAADAAAAICGVQGDHCKGALCARL